MRAQPTPAERWQALAEHLENYVRQSGRNLRFQVDERSGRVVVQVIDAENGTVIRQIPPEEVLRLARELGRRSPAGAVIDTRA
ncbi:MAG: flagellar protein FlaG [Gammaproteobacteria bacterium]|nr:flagellar protein FlaG [Gammaproteobacteria bacterium]